MRLSKAALLVVLISALLSSLPGCTSLSFRPKNALRTLFHVSPRPDSASRERIEGSMDRVTATRLTHGNLVELLTNGHGAFPEMLSAIHGARQRVSLETFILRLDETGKQFLDALIDAARRGVEVRLLIDSIGSLSVNHGNLAGLLRAGGEVRFFNPFTSWTIARINNRDHRKILVVDGWVAFMGGQNLADNYDGDGFSGFRDTAVRVEGPAALEAERIFAQSWQQGGWGWFGKDLPIVGAGLIKRGMDTPFRLLGLGNDFKPPVSRQATSGGVGVRAVSSSPDWMASRLLDMYLLAINSARERIYITNSYFVPPAILVRALIEAADRGVDVRLLLPDKPDKPVIGELSRAAWGPLLGHGVRIYEWHHSMLHAKTIVVDGEWSSVGSCNLNSRGFFLNYEANFAITDRAFGAAMERQFLKDIEQAEEITFRRWQRRSLFEKIKEKLFLVLKGQF